MPKSTDRFHEYARLGAAIRRAELVDEMRAIDKAFPELRFQKRTAALLKRSGSAAAEPTMAEDEPVSRPRRKRRKLTAAEKKFISARMKKYWAARKRKEA